MLVSVNLNKKALVTEMPWRTWAAWIVSSAMSLPAAMFRLQDLTFSDQTEGAWNSRFSVIFRKQKGIADQMEGWVVNSATRQQQSRQNRQDFAP